MIGTNLDLSTCSTCSLLQNQQRKRTVRCDADVAAQRFVTVGIDRIKPTEINMVDVSFTLCSDDEKEALITILLKASWEHVSSVLLKMSSLQACRVIDAPVPDLSPSTYSSSVKAPARLCEAASYIWGSCRFIEALSYPKYSSETSYGTQTPRLRLHWSWETFRDEVLKMSKKKGPSCLGKKVVGVML